MHLGDWNAEEWFANDIVVFLGIPEVSLAHCLETVVVPRQRCKVSQLRAGGKPTLRTKLELISGDGAQKTGMPT